MTVQYYHKRWQEEDTRDNFFQWLDNGDGKDLSLNECPRERLEQEVSASPFDKGKLRRLTQGKHSKSENNRRYLSTEQRLNYLVKVGENGRLLWAKNNQPIDTTAGHWKDAGDGQGIVPISMPARTPMFRHRGRRRLGSSLSSLSSMSSVQQNEATHYAGGRKGGLLWARALRRTFTPTGMMERLLRKTVKRNTWIYVSDKHFNIFIGIKETGTFQHSSFVSGGIVSSAGLITVKQGQIHTLSPLSGHYRTSIDHFHKFVKVLQERGVDISKVKISKAEAALWGIEHLGKMKKKEAKIMSAGKKKVRSILPTKKDTRSDPDREGRER
ncbi:hypothetical protein D9756_004145 [Leucocoprinus leucothites]|uniref:Uncharacterized protein n=1 Tax=Leucocoprinus leucothites TaxID=201217 RepID=A0A8H5DA20_9AGAR|nr:hypothetical protein D9756_004145 [Leucoagaricus leucothites]